MKKIIILLLLCLAIKSFGQKTKEKETQIEYEYFLKNIKTDTLVKEISRNYVCSEDVKGRIEFYYKADVLQLIKHSYKQGYYDDYHIEHYFVQEKKLSLVVNFREIIHLNTYSSQNEYETTAAIEKVLELVEQRTVIKDEDVVKCYERRYGKKLAEWDQSYFETLPFETIKCVVFPNEIEHKYRILRKAERVLKKRITKNPPCLFYMW